MEEFSLPQLFDSQIKNGGASQPEAGYPHPRSVAWDCSSSATLELYFPEFPSLVSWVPCPLAWATRDIWV